MDRDQRRQHRSLHFRLLASGCVKPTRVHNS
jgi:hypothetical protein